MLSFEEKYIDSASVREKYMTDNIRSNIIIIASKAYEELNLVGPVRFDFMYSMIEEGINRYQQDKNLKLKYDKSSLSRLSKVSKFKKWYCC